MLEAQGQGIGRVRFDVSFLRGLQTAAFPLCPPSAGRERVGEGGSKGEKKRERRGGREQGGKLSSSYKITALSGYRHLPVTSFNLNNLLKDYIFRYNHIVS